MAKHSIFRMASMTKLIVTVAAMMLVEQGVFKINDPIARYLPELKDLKVEVSRTNGDGTTTTEDLPANRAVTIQDLMRHTSGFFYGGAMKSKRLKDAYEQANIEAGDKIHRRRNVEAADKSASLSTWHEFSRFDLGGCCGPPS